MIKISTRGIEELKAYLATLPRKTKIAAMSAAAEYLIGNDQHGLKHNPARVQHGIDNPYVWESEKQRRAYFATNGFGGGIPYQRTGTLKDAWKYTAQNSNWTMVKLENPTPYAKYVQGDQIQRGHIADNWRHYSDVIATNIKGAIRAAQAAVNALLKRR